MAGYNGFFISNSNYHIYISGCSAYSTYSNLAAELLAMAIALLTATDRNLQVHYVFSTNPEIPALLNLNIYLTVCHLSPAIHIVKSLLEIAGNPSVINIPKSWMEPAAKLAVLGTNLHTLNLFLSG